MIMEFLFIILPIHNSKTDAENGSNALDDYDNTTPNFQYLSSTPNVSETIWVSIIPSVM